jgi:hypothetical protein
MIIKARDSAGRKKFTASLNNVRDIALDAPRGARQLGRNGPLA